MLGREAVGCLVRDASSFTGGAGAAGESVASMPSGPSGPMESLSRLSSVVDCARLPYRRGVRDLVAAGFAPVLEVGEDGSWVVLEDDCWSAPSLAIPFTNTIYKNVRYAYLTDAYSPHQCLHWGDCDSSVSARAHLRSSISLPLLSCNSDEDGPSHGEPPSSIALHGLPVSVETVFAISVLLFLHYIH